MTNLTNSIEKLLETHELQFDIQKSKERFSYKPFAIRFKKLKNTLVFSRFLFHLFSVLTGLSFLTFLLNSAFQNFWISIVLSFVILLFWEFIKSEILTNVFDIFYSRGVVTVFLGIVAFLMLFASAFVSVNGAKEYYQKQDTSIESSKILFETKKDSIIQQYSNEVKSNENELVSFKKSISWRGKINIHNKTVSSTIASYITRIDALKSDSRIALLHLRNDFDATEKQLSEKQQFNILGFAILSGINELIIVLILWFLVYYEFRMGADHEKLTQASQKVVFDMPTIQKLMEYAALGNTNSLIAPTVPQAVVQQPIETPQTLQNEKSLGFQVGASKNAENCVKTQNEGSCKNCGSNFTKKTTWQKFCSKECRYKFHSFDLKKLLNSEKQNLATTK